MDIQTDINTGLSSKQVEKRIKEGLYNEPVKNQSKTVGQIIAGNLFTYFNLIFFIFTLLLALVHSYINMTFLPIIIINMFIGIIQEIRTKRVLDKLTLLNASYSTVIRDGKEKKVLSEELVLGDLCILGAGKQISADAVVVEGSRVQSCAGACRIGFICFKDCIRGKSVQKKTKNGDDELLRQVGKDNWYSNYTYRNFDVLSNIFFAA